jgi:hypothetical protein
MLPARSSHNVVPVQISGRREIPRGTRDPSDACGSRNNSNGTPGATAPALLPTEFSAVRQMLIPCGSAHIVVSAQILVAPGKPARNTHHGRSALSARTRRPPPTEFSTVRPTFTPCGSAHHRLVARHRVCANIRSQENPRGTRTPFDASGPRTERPVCPHPPSSPPSFRRFARYLSPWLGTSSARRTSSCLREHPDPGEPTQNTHSIRRQRPSDGTPCVPAPTHFPTELPPDRPVSPAIRHTISLRSKRQQPPNDIRDRQLRCGASSAAQNVRLFPWHLSPGCYIASPQKQKRRVSRETRRRFLPTTSPIKPFSSPTRGRFRSRAGSVQARRPALPAQTHPSPAHSRSRRFAAPPAHSARSAASPRPSRAAR